MTRSGDGSLRLAFAAGGLIIAVLTGACEAGDEGGEGGEGEVSVEECLGADVEAEAQCGTYQVTEDPGVGGSTDAPPLDCSANVEGTEARCERRAEALQCLIAARDAGQSFEFSRSEFGLGNVGGTTHVHVNSDGTGWLRQVDTSDQTGYDRGHAFTGFDAASCTELDCFASAAGAATEEEVCVDRETFAGDPED